MSVNNHNTAHRLSPEDEEFRHRVENGQFPLAEFNHLAHLQLAYCYLLNQDVVGALDRYRQTVKRLLELNNKDPGKYHETLTCAWLMTVSQRMLDALHVRCFGEFIRLHGDLTDVGLIQQHYSEARLFSALAKEHFLMPDRQPFGMLGQHSERSFTPAQPPASFV